MIKVWFNYLFFNMIAANNDPTLIFVLGSIGVLLFGAIGYGIYTTVGPKSGELRDTIKEHARMHELGIAHGHNKKELNHTHLNEIPKNEDNPSTSNKVKNENQSQRIN